MLRRRGAAVSHDQAHHRIQRQAHFHRNTRLALALAQRIGQQVVGDAVEQVMRQGRFVDRIGKELHIVMFIARLQRRPPGLRRKLRSIHFSRLLQLVDGLRQARRQLGQLAFH